MILHYLKIAWRNLWKYKMQTAVGILGLSVCLLGFVLSLYVCRTFWSIDECFPHKDRIVEITLTQENEHDVSGIPVETIRQLRSMNLQEVEAFTYVAFLAHRSFEVETRPEEMLPFAPLLCLETDTCFRRVFGTGILAGSWQQAAQTPNAVVLAASTARRLFGGQVEEAIGKRLLTTEKLPFSDRQSGVTYTVQAVMEDIPVNNSVSDMQHVDMLVLNDREGRLQYVKDNFTGGMGYALLREGDGMQALQDDIRSKELKQRLFSRDFDLTPRPLGHAFWEYASVSEYVVGTALAIGTLVLLVGLLNFFYFQIVTFLQRRREYSLRCVFGGRGTDLLWQLFTQAALTVTLAFLLLFILLETGAPVVQDTLKNIIPIDMAQLRMQCAQYLVLVLAGSLAICALTVRHIRRHELQTGIRGMLVGRNRHRVRNLVLGIQYFICWIFVTLGTALWLQADKTASELLGTLPQSEKARVLSIPLKYPSLTQADRLTLVERMKQHAGVEDCLLSDIAYTRGVSGNMLFTAPYSQPDAPAVECNVYAVGGNFFDFMRVPLVEGRLPESGTGRWLVADRDFARDIKSRTGQSPLGTVFYDFLHAYTTAAVCEPFRTDGYHQGQRKSAFILSDFHDYVAHCYLKCHKGQTEAVRAHVGQVLRQTLPPSLEPRISTLLKDIEETQWVENMLKDIVLFLAVACVVITLMGVYAAITLDARQRRKEVAIRKINGAGLRQVTWLFARTYLWLCGATALPAFPLLYGFLRYWSGMYDSFFHYGALFWCGIFVAVMAVTVLTIAWQVVQIARTSPAEVIKEMN